MARPMPAQETPTAGLAFIEKLGQALTAPSGGGADERGDTKPTSGPGLPAALLACDEQTGQPYLKLPLPKPELLQSVADLLGKLAGLGK